MTIAELNRKYCQQLQAKPLPTKALTLVFFALLNEQLASFFAGDIKKIKVNAHFSIPHTITQRVPLMGLFALLINAPLTHYGYKWIQQLVPLPLTPRKRVLQIMLSTGIITPVFCACFVSWIGLINNLKSFKDQWGIENLSVLLKVKKLTKLLLSTITSSLKANFVRVCSTSVITSPLFMVFAQKFVLPEAWTVFFAFCYFIVGTYNNTRVKITQKKLRQQQEKDKQVSESQEEKKSI